MSEADEFPSRDLTFEWGRTAPGDLGKVADSIDTKTLGVFASASLIIGVATSLSSDIMLDWYLPLLVVSLGSYLMILVMSVWGLWATTFPGPPSPSIIRKYYWKLQPEEAKTHYWQHLEDDYDKVYSKVLWKGNFLKASVPLLGVEVSTLMVWLLLGVIR